MDEALVFGPSVLVRYVSVATFNVLFHSGKDL